MFKELGESAMSGKSGSTESRDLGRLHLGSGISAEFEGQET